MTGNPRQQELDSVTLDELRAWLRGKAHTSVPLAQGYQAVVHLYQDSAGEYVIKRARGSSLRRRLGEAAIRHEEKIYHRLSEVPGVPRCMGLVDGKYLVLEHIPGSSLRKLEHELEDRELFFKKLLNTIQGMHAAGVAHGDLKRKDNILVGPNQNPFVVDFGVACRRNRSGQGWRGFLFRSIVQADYNAWIKHKYRNRREALSSDDEALYKPMRLEQLARGIRIIWQTLTLRRLRKRRRRAGNR